jgi:glyoxylase-like metal-dependent hydrolase (beta-lactamase superfamily II)
MIALRGALVVDSGINGEMARQIQDRVRKLTDKEILYLVNTNHHDDHTFEIMPFQVRSKTSQIARRSTA